MRNSMFKMLTPERVSLLLLAAILVIWAVVLIVRKPDVSTMAEAPALRTDTMIVVRDTTHVTTKETRNQKSKKRKNSPSDTHQRDHLNEPVNIE